MKAPKTLAALLLACGLLVSAGLPAHAAADKTSKYRVYQDDTALQEFADLAQAKQYAAKLSRTHVESIEKREWLWDNYPRYRLYQYNVSLPDWEFATLDAAKAVAQYYGHAAIRDLQSTGWVWNNYPRYRLYQGDITLDTWEFQDLKSAQTAAQYYKYTHVIDLNTNKWVWDNYTAQEKETLRAGDPVYRVYQGTYTADEWLFAYLEDAVAESLRWANSHVADLSKDGKIVYKNEPTYKVYQSDRFINEFVGLDEAIAYAQSYAHIEIVMNGKPIWNNYLYYRVVQNKTIIGEYRTIPEAVTAAKNESNVRIETYDGQNIWSNTRDLIYWGWHGVSAHETIKGQLQNVVGLDISSPSWFQLTDDLGTLKDASSKETAAWLKQQGYRVHPLVSNPFNDSSITSRFLTNAAAQQSFIQALVSKSAELGVDGINVDFESLAGKDRAAYTAFIEQLTSAAHDKGLLISIDLPRGSVRWNHQTAFDHEKLGQIVDYVITMTYDQHFSGSDKPGSVAGLPWVEEGIKEFLSYGIPRDKLLMGIPYYVRQWKINATGGLEENKAIYMKDIPALMQSKQPTATWDQTFQQYRIEYEENGFRYVFWLEEPETIAARVELAKQYDLAGVAMWRLGYEEPRVWQDILPKK